MKRAAANPSHGRWMWLLALGLLLATLAAYYPAWHGGMIWDDDFHVTRPELLSWHGLYRIWFDVGATLQYYPLLHSVFWLEHQLWGDATLGYHLLNILMHVAAALMVALILRRLAIPGACLAAAIFALHPVHVESVAWITELKNTLSTVFYLGAAMLYFRFDETRKRAYYVGALGVFVLALLSKTVTGTLPAALLVMFWWQRGRLSWKRDVVPLVPFFVLGMGGGMITAWWELEINKCVGPEFQFTIVERLLIAGRAVWFHLSKLFWPTNLAFIYPRWQIHSDVWLQYLFPLGWAALLAVLWAIRRWSRAPLAGMLFFCGTLFPMLGFFNLYTFRYSLVANHYQYLASVGIITLASAGATLLLNRLGLWHWPTGYVLCGLLLATLSGLTWRQSHQYADAETLYRTTLSLNPSCWMAHNNLGVLMLGGTIVQADPRDVLAHNQLGGVLTKPKRTDEAIYQIREALRINPGYANAHNNLGIALAVQGNINQAIAEFREALRLDPEYAEAYNNLGNRLLEQGNAEAAITNYRLAIKISPGNEPAQYSLANALAGQGSLDEAIEHFKEALLLNPNQPGTHTGIGKVLAAQGRLDEAFIRYQEALRLDPKQAEAYRGLGAIFVQRRDFPNAISSYRSALNIEPDSAPTLNNLATALINVGSMDEAITNYNEAIRIDPRYAEAYCNLGIAFAMQGKVDEAIAHLRKALIIQPGFPRALQYLELALQRK